MSENTVDMVNLELHPSQVEPLLDAVAEIRSKYQEEIRTARRCKDFAFLVDTLAEIYNEYNVLYVQIIRCKSRHNREQVAKGKSPVF